MLLTCLTPFPPLQMQRDHETEVRELRRKHNAITQRLVLARSRAALGQATSPGERGVRDSAAHLVEQQQAMARREAEALEVGAAGLGLGLRVIFRV